MNKNGQYHMFQARDILLSTRHFEHILPKMVYPDHDVLTAPEDLSKIFRLNIFPSWQQAFLSLFFDC